MTIFVTGEERGIGFFTAEPQDSGPGEAVLPEPIRCAVHRGHEQSQPETSQAKPRPTRRRKSH
jgi:hypothetical protein